MSAKAKPVASTSPITIDDLKHRANEVRDLAVSESRRVTREVMQEDAVRTALVVVGTVVVIASIAYFLGTRAGRSATRPPFE